VVGTRDAVPLTLPSEVYTMAQSAVSVIVPQKKRAGKGEKKHSRGLPEGRKKEQKRHKKLTLEGPPGYGRKRQRGEN